MIPPWPATVNRLPAHPEFPFPAVDIPACGGIIPPCGAVCVPFWNAIYIENTISRIPSQKMFPISKKNLQRRNRGEILRKISYREELTWTASAEQKKPRPQSKKAASAEQKRKNAALFPARHLTQQIQFFHQITKYFAMNKTVSAYMRGVTSLPLPMNTCRNV